MRRGRLLENNIKDYQWQNLETQTELEDLKQQLNSYFQYDDFKAKVLYDSTKSETENTQIITINQSTALVQSNCWAKNLT